MKNINNLIHNFVKKRWIKILIKNRRRTINNDYYRKNIQFDIGKKVGFTKYYNVQLPQSLILLSIISIILITALILLIDRLSNLLIVLNSTLKWLFIIKTVSISYFMNGNALYKLVKLIM